MISYREFVRLNLPHYIKAGFRPVGAMRMVARSWHHWKKGTTRNYVYYLVTKTGVKKLMRTKKKKNPESLYQAFHGSPPRAIRKVAYEPPKGQLVKIGRLVRIEYEPEYPSKRTGTRFYHELGDTGSIILPNKPLLVTDKKGKNLYIIKDKASTHFSERGIIG